jgi:hypothetical protein
MTPAALAQYLDGLVRHRLMLSTMIWGPPGIGKSSIVAQTADAHGLTCIDVRLSQLAPTDLRGLPVAADGVARWYPPEFLPRDGAGVLFLDEINLAPPAIQGMAQQLILDRRVGSYHVPDGWYIWAAGNRKEDRAAVFDMPAPLANRFLHLHVEPDLDSFKSFALASGVHEQIIAFLSYRPALLHKMDPQQPAWPSPRSWAMASALHHAGLDITTAVGPGVATESGSRGATTRPSATPRYAPWAGSTTRRRRCPPCSRRWTTTAPASPSTRSAARCLACRRRGRWTSCGPCRSTVSPWPRKWSGCTVTCRARGRSRSCRP